MWRALKRDENGTALVEAAIVFPLVLAVTLSIMEFGTAYSQWLRAEKATMEGARLAVTSTMAATGVSDCGVATSLPRGTPCRLVAGSAGWSVTCTSGATGCDAAAFTAIVTRMQAVFPRIAAANVVVRYSGTGLGFVGRGMPVPDVTVSLQDMRFDFIILSGFLRGMYGGQSVDFITMPDFRTTLTGEDLSS